MDPAVILLILRLVAALLLLGFLGLIVWFIYQDIRATRYVLAAREQQHGQLRVLEGNGESIVDPGNTFPLLPVTSIGRAPGNTIVLSDDYVSNEHALLMLRGQQWWLEDLNSRNGTLLNDAHLDGATVVSSGDILTIGRTRLKLEL